MCSALFDMLAGSVLPVAHAGAKRKKVTRKEVQSRLDEFTNANQTAYTPYDDEVAEPCEEDRSKSEEYDLEYDDYDDDDDPDDERFWDPELAEFEYRELDDDGTQTLLIRDRYGSRNVSGSGALPEVTGDGFNVSQHTAPRRRPPSGPFLRTRYIDGLGDVLYERSADVKRRRDAAF